MKLSTQILLAFTLVILLSVADSYTNYNLSIKVQRNSQFLSKSYIQQRLADQYRSGQRCLCRNYRRSVQRNEAAQRGTCRRRRAFTGAKLYDGFHTRRSRWPVPNHRTLEKLHIKQPQRRIFL